MKKVLLCSVLFTGVVMADNCTINNTCSSEGFYAGLGLMYNHSTNKLKATEGLTADGDAIVINEKIAHRKFDRAGGTLLAGYGKFYRDLYLGGEFLFDICKNKKVDGTYTASDLVSPYYAKLNGFIPTFALRFGYRCVSFNGMLYAKLGLALAQAEFCEKSNIAEQNIRKMRKVAPLIGFGIAKNICNRFNVRGEFEYRFKAKKTSLTNVPEVCKYNVENRLKGHTLRLMVTYKF